MLLARAAQPLLVLLLLAHSTATHLARLLDVDRPTLAVYPVKAWKSATYFKRLAVASRGTSMSSA